MERLPPTSPKMATEQTPHPLRHIQPPPPPQQQTTPETAPPPYTAFSHAQTPGEDGEDDDDDDDPPDSEADPSDPLPISLTINAAHTITGSNNLIPTTPSSPSPTTLLQDATRLSTLLLATLNQINHHPSPRRAKCPLKLDLTIHCGLTVVGDRNVVGNVMLKPKGPGVGALAGPGAGVARAEGQGDGAGDVVAGAKRKVEDGGREEGGGKRGRM
ncbi:hypothetical protein Tdes44962_MAKER08117 [Teratosphaeria destructans]|uniref:Uncharacterized protein n=1 Tax=Teratosphaeria destructans TaxID=418781 RepID=A0A9W7SXV3_9PEZI|nr:hypothetical protein Tdes44962_MAKER08117 [Teratosphaeria destructans]